MNSEHEIKMWTPHTVVLFLFVIIGAAVAGYRMVHGLGASTNMGNIYPWGFWLGFDVLGGVAMAGGGFIIAAAIYLFNWKKYKPIGRPAILTAFLGYLMAIIALFFDIGHPIRLWHPAIMWQIHSVMWVVAIHVILYTTTLGIESSPMFFERFKMSGALSAVQKIMIGAVIFGVMLSTLHQSSLGAVFLITPSRMSPLWFNTMLPYLFLLSCIPMGLAMVSTESLLSAKAFKHDIDREIYYGLARGTLISLLIYLACKLFFLFRDAGIGAIFDGSMEANMYLIEMIIGVILPILMLASKQSRTNLRNIFAVNFLVIIGVLVNRMNVCIFSMQDYTTSRGASYFPSAMELLLTLGIVALGIFLFKMAAKYLPLFAKA